MLAAIASAGAGLLAPHPPASAQADVAAQYTPYVAPASGEAAQAMAAVELADGLAIELFAAEPMLANPVCLYVDFQGDVYVGETFRHHAGVTDIREHMSWLDDDLASGSVADRVAMIAKHEGDNFPFYSKDQDRVRLIRDTDGDRRADAAFVFADGFDAPSAGIGAGVLAYRGDVYYTCIPDLWLLRDADGDGQADERRVLSTGYGVNVALLGHDLHGLRIGPDQRLYFSVGDRGCRVETTDGVIDLPKQGSVFRCNLDGTGLEVVHTGLRNPQELVFDKYGNLWTGDNNSDGGDRARWVQVVEGADSGWRYPYQWISEPNLRGPWNDEKLWHPPHPGQAAYIVPPVANLADGPSGLTYYPGTGLDPRWADHFFLADFRGAVRYSGVHAFTVQPKGAGFELGPVERFVWNTLVTDCDFGPDGGFYLTDWVEGWNKTGKGRVFRVFDPRLAEDEDVLSTRSILAKPMRPRGYDGLKTLLFHPDMRVRQEAQFTLAELGATGLGIFIQLSRESDDLLARLHSIWGLGNYARRDPRAYDYLTPLLASDEPEVRAQTVKLLGDARYTPAASLLVPLIGDPHPRVRFFAAIAAGRLQARGAVAPLRELFLDAGEDDPNLRHAAVMGLLGCASEAELEDLARDPSPHVRMGALLVGRRRAEPAVARFLEDPEPALVFEAARAIGDVPIDAARGALAALALEADAPNGLIRRVMNAAFREGGAEDARRLARLVQRDDLPASNRVEGLALLATWDAPAPRDRVTNFWRPLDARAAAFLPALAAELGPALAGAPEEVQSAWARLAGAAPSEASAGRLGALVGDADAASGVRVAALEALQRARAPELATVVDRALSDADGAVRAAALSVLERLAPAEALPRVRSILASGDLRERRVAYRILGGAHTPAAAALLGQELSRLDADLVAAELALDLVRAVEANGAEDALALLSARATRRSVDPPMAPYLDSLFGGDPKLGRRVFERAELSCVRCHARDDAAGETVGPDLRDLSQRLTRLQMLESIVQPNRVTTPGFQNSVLFFADGSALSGRVLEEGLLFPDSDGEWLRLMDADGELHEVALDDVEERRPDLSAMPEDLVKELDRFQMRDLLAYLATL